MIAISLILAGGAIGFYAFAGYPLLLMAGRLIRRRPPPGTSGRTDGAPLPPISITVPIFNEAHQLEELLESLTALEYPEGRRQILIVSDGSTDESDEIARRWQDRGVELLRVDQRGGKCAAENSAREHLTGDIIINTDASIRIRPRALLPMVRPFSDPDVGVVSGRDASTGTHEEENQGEAGYVGYEMWVRDLETDLGGIVGASGSFYATRKHLHAIEIPPELSRDFASALVAADHGLAAVSARDAVALVPRTRSLRSEYRRKVRTVARGMTTLWAWRHLLNPVRHPRLAWKLFSHKICRWAVPLAALLVAAGVLILAVDHAWARWLLALGALGGGLGALGWMVAGRTDDRRLPWLLSVPAFLIMSNVAVIHAFFRALGGGSERVWEPTRRGLETRTADRS